MKNPDGDEDKENKKEEKKETPVIDPVLNWFGSIFNLCGTTNGCCGDDNKKETKIN